jgi:hypothetical protein
MSASVGRQRVHAEVQNGLNFVAQGLKSRAIAASRNLNHWRADHVISKPGFADLP